MSSGEHGRRVGDLPAWRDLLYVTTIVALAFFLFLRRWPLWEDQSIYHYMAWAARHGLVLYRDAINMNWPGCVVLHMLAQALAGMDGQGVRLIEAVFLCIQGLATSAILRAYGVGSPFRIAALTVFLIAYFDGGYAQTAQRESFMTPCLAVALVPLLTTRSEGARRDHVRWFTAGAFAAFGGSVKPTMWVPLAGVALVTLLSWRGTRRALCARFGAYVGGAVTVFAGLLGFLYRYADLRNFYRWGVAYTFGPYATLRLSGAPQVNYWMSHLTALAMAPTVRLCLAGVLASAIVVAASALRIARAEGGAPAEAAEGAWRTVQLVLLVCLIGLTIYLQGKTYCVYHFIPLKWGLSLLGAALTGGAWPSRIRGYLVRRPSLRAALAYASFVAGASFFAASERDLVAIGADSSRNPLADKLAEAMAPHETVVVFGFAPSLLWTLQRPTPLPFVDSWIMYAGAPEGSAFRQEFMRRWERALADPNVRFFVVQPGLELPPGLRFDPNRPERSEVVVRERFPDARLQDLGFALTQAFDGSSGGLLVYERVRR
jgi:hypothetical protein